MKRIYTKPDDQIIFVDDVDMVKGVAAFRVKGSEEVFAGMVISETTGYYLIMSVHSTKRSHRNLNELISYYPDLIFKQL